MYLVLVGTQIIVCLIIGLYITILHYIILQIYYNLVLSTPFSSISFLILSILINKLRYVLAVDFVLALSILFYKSYIIGATTQFSEPYLNA